MAVAAVGHRGDGHGGLIGCSTLCPMMRELDPMPNDDQQCKLPVCRMRTSHSTNEIFIV
jgi:hypothetical protein